MQKNSAQNMHCGHIAFHFAITRSGIAHRIWATEQAMAGFEPWYADWCEEVARFVARLNQDGYDARCTCHLMPIQLEATLSSGTCFYFREEYGVASLQIIVPEWLAFGHEWTWADVLEIGRDNDFDVAAIERAFRELSRRYIDKYSDALPASWDSAAPAPAERL